LICDSYILNRGWIDRSTRRVPTYNEITHTGSDDEEDDEDEFDEIIDRFESSYNFRFEEPDASVIKTYPRQLPSTTPTVRRPSAAATARKDARERRKERKREEVEKRKEEVRRLRALKMKELRGRLETLAVEGGLERLRAVGLGKGEGELDLEGDWDPGVHDRQMGVLYADDGDGGGVDEGKPTWDDDIDIGDIAVESKSKKKKKKKKGEGEVDVGVDIDDMDADVERVHGGNEEEWDGTEEMRKKKISEYMDEVYGLEFNDIVRPFRIHSFIH